MRITRKKTTPVIQSTVWADRLMGVYWSKKYLINEAGIPVSPSLRFTSQCHSVRKQYPSPYFNPSTNQEKIVAITNQKCHFLVFLHIQPNILKVMIMICNQRKRTSSSFHIDYSYLLLGRV